MYFSTFYTEFYMVCGVHTKAKDDSLLLYVIVRTTLTCWWKDLCFTIYYYYTHFYIYISVRKAKKKNSNTVEFFFILLGWRENKTNKLKIIFDAKNVLAFFYVNLNWMWRYYKLFSRVLVMSHEETMYQDQGKYNKQKKNMSNYTG